MTTFITSCFVISIQHTYFCCQYKKAALRSISKNMTYIGCSVRESSCRLVENETSKTIILPFSYHFLSTIIFLTSYTHIKHLRIKLDAVNTFSDFMNRPISHLFSSHGTRRWEKSVFTGRKKAKEECNIKLFDDHRSNGFITRW